MFPPKPPVTNPPARRGGVTAESLIVAVKAENVISNSGLAWALTHTARPGDCITLLAVFSENETGRRRFWGFPRLRGDCRSGDPTVLADRISQISESCSQMVLHVPNEIQVSLRIKVVSAISAGAVAAESKSSAAKWVILDKRLKRELKHCMDELQCNIVVMKGSHPRVFRLNLARSNDLQMPFYSAASSPLNDSEKLHSRSMKHKTPVSSPEDPNTSYTRTSGENSLSSPGCRASTFVVYEKNPLYEGFNKDKLIRCKQISFDHLRERAINSSATPKSETCRNQTVFWIAENHTVGEKVPASGNFSNISKTASTLTRTKSYVQYNKKDITKRALAFNQNSGGDYMFNSSIREVVSLSKSSSTPPPLCSMCQFKAPEFGIPPKQFQYKELEEATDGFSDTNFVAEGGFGLVHRGFLRNGLIIAVKQLEFVGPERDADFCQEVRILSCAQHRNVVLLIGFCIEGKKRLLVYEYVCNNSLNFHLHGNELPVLDWQARLKIAIGTARGLRYLHEDCRVGCIIHSNLRPDNILLTHDFEPLVADFGLAKLHNEWKFFDKNQMVGTSGYLAPEYFNDGKMTEKVDIYAFGLILLELITGQRASGLQYSMEHQLLLDNICALAAIKPIHNLAYKHQLLDPRLASHEPKGLPFELHAMGYAASLCLQQDPDLRPPMSKVVKILEGGSPDTPVASDLDSIGCKIGPMQGLESKRRHSRRLSY